MKIGYVTFGKDDFGYGISYILDLNGIKAERVSIKTARQYDIVLFSIFWWAHVYRFVDFCVKAGIGWKRDKPTVIVGGFNSFNPKVFMPWAHKIVVGDGESVIRDAVEDKPNESIYTGIEKEIIYSHCSIKRNSYTYRHNDMSRVEIARGCKYKCPYCQLAHLKPYREVDVDCVLSAIDGVETKRIALFAPNGMTHKNYNEIIEHARGKQLVNVATDVRYNELDLYQSDNTATLGIEGISAKLRKAVTKPLDSDGFIDLIQRRMKQCADRGFRPSIHTYFILDIPGETEADWEEFDDLLNKINKVKGIEDLTWIFTGNVFMPAPHTPFESKKIHVERDYKKIWRSHLQDYDRSEPFKFTVAGRHSVFSPYSRLLSMIATRGGDEAGQLIYQITANKELKRRMLGPWKRSLGVLIRFIDKNFGTLDDYIGENKKKPWDFVKVSRKWVEPDPGE